MVCVINTVAGCILVMSVERLQDMDRMQSLFVSS